jgi:peptide/nickel transport system permease protein
MTAMPVTTMGRTVGRTLRRTLGRAASRVARRPTYVVSAAVTAAWVFVAVAWPLFVPYGPDDVDPAHPFGRPDGAHLFGTDWLGRDVLSRTLAGATSTVELAPAITALAVAAGTALALAAGYFRGAVDMIVMRVVDGLTTIPGIVISVLALAVLGRSQVALVLVVAFGFTPLVTRTVRSAVLGEVSRDYVDAARLRKEPAWYVMFAEILPNVTAPVLVEATVRLGYAVFAVSTLAFLGLGPQQPSPDWGLSVSLGVGYVQTAPWILLAPALAIASLVVAVTILGDEIRGGAES